MTGETPLRVSQDYEVLRPKHDKVFPIPCNEWDLLRSQIEDLTNEPWLFHTAGSVLIGAALATLISIWTDTISPSPQVIVIAWAIVATCGITGLASLFFAQKERGVDRNQARLIVKQMQLIEERFERGQPHGGESN